MSNRPQTMKGMRDHLPGAMLLRKYIIETLTGVFERHGFEPLQTPILEYAETLEGKIGEDEKLIYRFEDNGGRRVALRYDQTVPLARVVAQHQNELTFPWRRYAIGQSYRGERQQRGRYREFWQADIDIVGVDSAIADAEIIAVIDEALAALGFSGFTTMINHRDILSGMARAAGLDAAAAGSVYRAIDKFDKVGAAGVRTELINSGVAETAADHILAMVQLQGAPELVLGELTRLLADDDRALAAIERLRTVIAHVRELGVPEQRYTIAPQLARGLSYYTGVVFETVVETPPMGSLLGGGRYDELVGMFAGKSLPTVGMAFGIERLHDVMTELGMGPQNRTVSQAFVTLFNADMAGESLRLAGELRAAGIKVETALDAGEKIGKQFKYADRKGIPLALVIGPDDASKGEVVLKHLQTGAQRAIARADVVAAVLAALNPAG